MTTGLNAEPRLSYSIELLRELFKLTDKTKFRVLAYILSMAIIEAEDAYRKLMEKRE